MSKKCAFCRVMAGVIVLAFAGAGLHFYTQGVRSNQKADRTKEAETIRLDVDISKTDEYQGVFRHAHDSFHGPSLTLRVTPGFATVEEAQAAFHGFGAEMRWHGADGRIAFKQPLTPDHIAARTIDGDIEIHTARGILPMGTYAFALDVANPAPKLAGRKQTLLGRYEFCGLEYFPGALLRLIGIACRIVGGVVLLILLMIYRIRRNRRRDLPPEPDGDDCPV